MIHFPPNRVFENRYQDVPSSGGSLIPGRLRHSRLTSNRIDVSSTKPEVQAKLSDAQKGSRSSAHNGWPYFPSLACGADWGYPEFPKKFWKGASCATGHWYNRTSLWSRQTSPRGRCAFSIWLWEHGCVGLANEPEALVRISHKAGRIAKRLPGRNAGTCNRSKTNRKGAKAMNQERGLIHAVYVVSR